MCADDFDNDDFDGAARNTDPLTSHDALEDGDELRNRIADEVLPTALQPGFNGITINEAVFLLPQYKAWSIGPIFAPLVRKGLLVRASLGLTPPTKRWPNGKTIYQTRADPDTHKQCIVNFHPTVFAKKPPASVLPRPEGWDYGS